MAGHVRRGEESSLLLGLLDGGDCSAGVGSGYSLVCDREGGRGYSLVCEGGREGI